MTKLVFWSILSFKNLQIAQLLDHISFVSVSLERKSQRIEKKFKTQNAILGVTNNFVVQKFHWSTGKADVGTKVGFEAGKFDF